MAHFKLALVGRPNVGKSTLFNRLVGRRLALVDDQPGVTRDLREGAGRIGPLRFTVIDTAGLEAATDDSLQGRMRKLTERAVDMADICLFMIDARVGVARPCSFPANMARGWRICCACLSRLPPNWPKPPQKKMSCPP